MATRIKLNFCYSLFNQKNLKMIFDTQISFMPLIRFEFKYSLPATLEDHLNCNKFKHHVLLKNTI